MNIIKIELLPLCYQSETEPNISRSSSYMPHELLRDISITSVRILPSNVTINDKSRLSGSPGAHVRRAARDIHRLSLFASLPAVALAHPFLAPAADPHAVFVFRC